MNRSSVTQAQLRRAVQTFEALGKPVKGAILRPDGSMEVFLTDGLGALHVSKEQAEGAWDAALGIK